MKVKFNNKVIEFPEKTTIMDYLRKKNEHIPGVCKIMELEPYGSCRLCLIDINDRILTACSTNPRENDIIDTYSKEVLDIRKSAIELMLSDHYGDCIGPCNDGCPSKSDVQGYLALAANGKFFESVSLMKKDYILPASLGRICPAFCERDCRRNLVDQPVAIRQLKRFIADYDLKHGPWMPEIPAETGKKIAIIGGGPAGLSCAYYLRTKGHEVVLYEAMPELGGMLRYGIPEFRLPKDILRKDIETVINTGIKVKTNTKVGNNISFETLQKDYDAIFVAIGAWKSLQLRLEGCDMPGVFDAIDFLRRINKGEEVDIGQNVMVIGGGNSAMDVARTAKRLGCNVTITYRRTRNEMPAEENEIKEAEEEGVEFNLLSNPIKIIGEENVNQIELIKMELGEPDESGRCRPIACEGTEYCLDIDTLIFAVGQSADKDFLEDVGLKYTINWADYNKTTYETNIPGVFVGGDLALSPSTVIEAIATGKESAIMIDLFVRNKLSKYKKALEEPWEHLNEIEADEELKKLVLSYRPYNHWKKVTEDDYKDIERINRVKSKIQSIEKRASNFDEVEETLSQEEVMQEVQRCMSCGCLDSFECKLREYAKLYDAKQDQYEGELHKDKIDDSHKHIILDNNKCILCGRCVNLTHEITGEGLIDNLNRGFPTKNGPPVNTQFSEINGDFVGNFVDVCPTGAFVATTPFNKNGPWDIISMPTICNSCGIGCEMNIDIYKDFAVNISANEDSWNHGLVCDKPRFYRTWEKDNKKSMKKSGKGYTDITMTEAKEIISKYKKDLAIVLAPDITNDEALKLREFSEKQGIKISAIYEKGISTAKLADIFKSKCIKLDVSLSDYPLLKPFLHIAKKQGAIISNESYDLAILNAPSKAEKVPTIIMHKGLNEVGLMQLKFEEIPKAKAYLIIGTANVNLTGFIISMGYNENADLILPFPAWISRSGKIVNTVGRELEVKKIFDDISIIEILESLF